MAYTHGFSVKKDLERKVARVLSRDNCYTLDNSVTETNIITIVFQI